MKHINTGIHIDINISFKKSHFMCGNLLDTPYTTPLRRIEGRSVHHYVMMAAERIDVKESCKHRTTSVTVC